MTSPYPVLRLTLDRALQTADNLPFGEAEEEQCRQHCQRRERENAGRVLAVFGGEILYAQRQGLQVGALQDKQRQEERVPTRHEGEHANRDQRGPRQREEDPPEEAEP